MKKLETLDLDRRLEDILGDEAYNEAAFMFDDNKMRFCFTPEELIKKQENLKQLISEVLDFVIPSDHDFAQDDCKGCQVVIQMRQRKAEALAMEESKDN